jgi:hypothetical protein
MRLKLRLDWARFFFAIGLRNSHKCLSNRGKLDPCHRINKAFHLKLVGLEGLLSTSNRLGYRILESIDLFAYVHCERKVLAESDKVVIQVLAS